MQLSDIKFDKHNYRKHSAENQKLIKKSLEETGFGRSVLIDSENCLIAGNGVVSQLPKNTKIKVVETDGTEMVVVKRTDLKTSDRKRKELARNDNATANNVEWDGVELTAEFAPEELEQWQIDVQTLQTAEDDFPELPEGDGSGFEQMTFTLSNRQAQIVKDALAKAKESDAYKYLNQEENSNSNGNALFCIMEGYLQ